MAGIDGGSGRGTRITTALVVTLGLGAGYLAMKQAGLFSQIGPTPTRLLIGADLLVVGLIWYRVLAR